MESNSIWEKYKKGSLYIGIKSEEELKSFVEEAFQNEIKLNVSALKDQLSDLQKYDLDSIMWAKNFVQKGDTQDLSYFEEEEITKLLWEDYLKENYIYENNVTDCKNIKELLKTGMVVNTFENKKYLVFKDANMVQAKGDFLLNIYDYNEKIFLDIYDKNLLHKTDSLKDIKEIYIVSLNEEQDDELLWSV